MKRKITNYISYVILILIAFLPLNAFSQTWLMGRKMNEIHHKKQFILLFNLSRQNSNCVKAGFTVFNKKNSNKNHAQ
jgi:hypothetical protein